MFKDMREAAAKREQIRLIKKWVDGALEEAFISLDSQSKTDLSEVEFNDLAVIALEDLAKKLSRHETPDMSNENRPDESIDYLQDSGADRTCEECGSCLSEDEWPEGESCPVCNP